MLETIKDIFEYIGLFIISLLIFIGGMFLLFLSSNNCYRGSKIFEYEDLNGNTGIADNCQYSDAQYYGRKGGQGQPICFIGKRIITVKWYEDKTKYMSCYKTLKGE